MVQHDTALVSPRERPTSSLMGRAVGFDEQMLVGSAEEPPRRAGGRSSPLRFIVPAGALLALVVAVLLIVSTEAMEHSVQGAARNAESIANLLRIQSDLGIYSRTSVLFEIAHDPALSTERLEARSRIRADIREAARLSMSADERRRVEELRSALETYFSKLDALESSGTGSVEILLSMREDRARLDRAFAAVEAFHRNELAESRRHSSNVNRGANIVGVLVAMLVLIGVALSTAFYRRHVSQMVGDISRGIDRFRSGEAFVAGDASSEVRTIMERLEAVTAELAAHRKNQLTFLAGVAHDLRNPLSGLRMAITLLRETTPELEREPQARTLTLLDRLVERLARLASDLVDTTRIEAGELRLDVREIDFREPLRSIVELYAPTATAHRIELHLPDEPVLIRADPQRIEQVLGNLISNAIKYSPEGGRIDVELRTSHDEAIICVSDSGVGMAPEEIAEIFMPFRRLKSSADIAPGAGLGLSVVRHIVHAHGGRIEVESEPGKGSTFRVHLPRLRSA